jgi:hypothetical protein
LAYQAFGRNYQSGQPDRSHLTGYKRAAAGKAVVARALNCCISGLRDDVLRAPDEAILLMRWQLFRKFSTGGSLLALCAVVVSWVISGGAIVGAVTLLWDGVSWPLSAGVAVVLGLPVLYAAGAVISYFRDHNRR